jgi:hypothetical protein
MAGPWTDFRETTAYVRPSPVHSAPPVVAQENATTIWLLGKGEKASARPIARYNLASQQVPENTFGRFIPRRDTKAHEVFDSRLHGKMAAI